jgi:hypothetical protein
MKKFIFSLTLLVALFVTNANAQFTNKLENVCVDDVKGTITGNGTITFPASDFAICAYTTQIFVGDKWVDVKVNDKTPQNGKYSFSYPLPSGVKVYYQVKVRTVTNRQTASEFSANRAVCDAVRFKNRFTANQWIGISGGPEGVPAAVNPTSPAGVDVQWRMVPVAGTKFFRLMCVWGMTQKSLNIEKGALEASAAPEAFHSGHWELEEVVETRAAGAPVYYRLKNRWKPEIYLNTEGGKLQASAVPLAFQSANWLVEKIWQ